MTVFDQKFGAWSAFIFAGFLGLALIVAGFLPPPSPMLDPAEVQAIYQENQTQILIAMFLGMVGAVFIVPFAAAISAQMDRMQGVSRMPSYMQLGAGAAGAIPGVIPFYILAINAFRPDRDMGAMFLFHDAAFLLLVGFFPLAAAQNLAIALGVLLDKSEQPVFPRWLAYFNLWMSVLIVAGGLGFFFKEGPFAWNGILVFWIAASAFFIWLVVMAIMLLKAINNSQQQMVKADH